MELISINQPDERWDNFVNQYSNIIFHKAIWAKVLLQAYPKNKLLYLVLKDDKKWLLAMPGIILNYKFLHIFHSVIYYGGFIGNKRYIPIFLELLEKEVKRYRLDRIYIIDPTIEIKEQMHLHRFRCRESYRHILRLENKSFDEVWKGYKKILKRSIKEAIKSNLTFHKISTRQQVNDFYKLYLYTMQRNNTPAKYPISLVYAIYDLMDDETKDIFFVKYNNIVVAGIIIIYSIDTAYFIQGCSDTQYLYLNPNDFLLHESIKVALEREKRYVDFLGTDKKLPSLIKFKDKFGTQKEELFNFYKDIGITKPFIWNIGYKFANTSFGAQVVNKILYLKECGFYL